MEASVTRAAQVLPSERQVAWNCMEFYGFVHFGLYTFGPNEEGGMGPDVRWIGNEAGISREFIKDYDKLIWYPAEVDVSIRPSWGYRDGEEKRLHSLETLLHMYEKAVGGNANLLLNVPPNREGLFDGADVERLSQLGEAIREMFSKSCLAGARAKDLKGQDAKAVLNNDREQFFEGPEEEMFAVEIVMDGDKEINLVTIKETIEKGQRIEAFCLEIFDGNNWIEVYNATTIGYQRICRFETVRTGRLRICILKARGRVSLTEVGVYCDERKR